MPEPYLTEEWRVALTTFLLGSVGTEGANVPSSLFFSHRISVARTFKTAGG